MNKMQKHKHLIYKLKKNSDKKNLHSIYKLISWDFELVLEQIAERNEGV